MTGLTHSSPFFKGLDKFSGVKVLEIMELMRKSSELVSNGFISSAIVSMLKILDDFGGF